MPFGLKNVGATYQRLVNHMFRPQIGQNVEVYVNDMLVKSQDEEIHLDSLQETFDTFGSAVQHEVESQQVCFRSIIGKIPRLYGFTQRN